MQPQRKKIILAVSCLLAIVLMMFGSSDASQETFYGGHLSLVDGSVLIQSAYDSELLTAEMNLLVEEGTRIVTARDGRAEVQLSGNDILRLWHDTEVDFIDVEGPVEVWMKLGSVYVRTNPERGKGCRQKIVTPTSTVCVTGGTILRIDVEHEERTRVTVLEGNAEVFSGSDSVLVHSQQMVAVGVTRIYGPTGFNADHSDRFVRWCDERNELLGSPINHRYPATGGPAAINLDHYGSWAYVPELSVRVWRPRVVAGWGPYRHGRWSRSLRHGWFWVSYEPWGWVPYHYGSWSWHSPLGWVWVPGHVWHAARVSWVVSGDYIGWRPLLYRPNRVTVKIPAEHHRYSFVHKTSITRPQKRSIELDKSHFHRHRLESVNGPNSIIAPVNRVRKGPDKAVFKEGYAERPAKQVRVVRRHAGDRASHPSRRSGLQNRSSGERLVERRPETRKHAKPKIVRHGQDAGTNTKRIGLSKKPTRRTGTPVVKHAVTKDRNRVTVAGPPSRRNPGFGVPKTRSKPVVSPRPKGDRANSPDHGSIAARKPRRTSLNDRGSSSKGSRSVRQPSQHRGEAKIRGHGTGRKSHPSKPRSSNRTSSQRGRR